MEFGLKNVNNIPKDLLYKSNTSLKKYYMENIFYEINEIVFQECSISSNEVGKMKFGDNNLDDDYSIFVEI